MIGRRAFLSAGLSALATAPLAQIRPKVRPARPVPRPASPPVRDDLAALIARANLGDGVAIRLIDLQTGAVLLDRLPDTPMPPASVTKAVTALYALDQLGPDYRFATRLLATGPIKDGMVQGDLILAGGGDPVLNTDDLAGMAAALAGLGLRGITGAFRVWGGALPYAEEIEPGQLDHLGYNPAVSGLNLNFNRVHFEWRRAGGNYRITMDARTEIHRPDVTMATMRVANRSLPIYDHHGPDQWSVARGALGKGGARWLPVRQPALYAGDVFRTLAAGQGVTLPAAERIAALPKTDEILRHDSPPLTDILQGMLYYSTNLTAEVVGLAATAQGAGLPSMLAESAAQMNTWLAAQGVTAQFVDHSGLSDENRISAAQMGALLQTPAAQTQLHPILKKIDIKDADDYPGTVMAKTGTLNFVSTLSGYVTGYDGREMAFVIFTADLPRRNRAGDDEIPAGSISWNSRAKTLQDDLLKRWSLKAKMNGPDPKVQ